MKKAVSILLLIFYVVCVHAQENILIRGVVIDESTRKPLSKASVSIKEINGSAITDFDGQFTVLCKECNTRTLKIEVSYVGYEPQRFTLNLNTTSTIVIRLKQTSMKLGEVSITPQLMKYIFFGSMETQVLDYVFFQSGWLIALYNFSSDKIYLVYLGKSKDILFEKEFTNRNFENFFVSCNNRYYAETGKEVYEIFITNSGIEYKPVDSEFFNKGIKFYAGMKDKYFYITKFNTYNLVQGFFLDDTRLKKIEEEPFATVVRVQDIKLMKSIASTSFITPLDDTRSGPHNRKPQLDGSNPTSGLAPLPDGWNSDINSFFRDAYIESHFKETFAPFYVIDSTLVLINYYQNYIEKHRIDGKLIDTVSLKIRNEKKSRQTFYDEVAGKIYYRSEVEYYGSDVKDTTIINELNIITGEDSKAITVSRRETYNIKVNDGYVYYLFNPSKTNNVFLFREKIGE